MSDDEKKRATRKASSGPSYTVYDIDILEKGDPEEGRAPHRVPRKPG